jgi:hypothetical protein
LEGWHDEVRDERLVPSFFLGKARNLDRLFVPFIDSSVDVDSKDGCIGRVDKLAKFRGP